LEHFLQKIWNKERLPFTNIVMAARQEPEAVVKAV